MGNKQIEPFLLHLYIRGKCTREQLMIVRQYLTDPSYEESLNQFLRSDWEMTIGDQSAPVHESQEAYQHFLSIVQPVPGTTPVVTAVKLRRLPARKVWWAVAAAAIICISIARFSWLHTNQTRQDIARWMSIYNEAGERTAFFLPDSSKVYLGAASRLEYNTGYGVTNRNLRLKGEAYFIVNHQGDQPFAVTTGQLTTVDIGTEFNIRFIQNSPAIEVGVAKGLVDVLNNTDKKPATIARLGSRQLLRFDTASRKATIHALPEGEIGAWRKGLLVFRKQKFSEVAAELERYYGLHIHFDKEEHARILITTTLQNATVAEALEIIALTAGVKIKQDGNNVRIY